MSSPALLAGHRRTTYSADSREGDDRAQEVTGQEPAVGGQGPHQPGQKTCEMRVQTQTGNTAEDKMVNPFRNYGTYS